MKHNRVLVFSTDDYLYPAGGAEQAFGNIAARLPQVTFDLVCAKLRPGTRGYEEVGNVRIHRMGFGVPRLDGFIVALFGHFCAYKLMRKYSYDFMWSIMASYGGFAAVRVKRKTGIPFLLTLQEGDSLEHIYQRVRFVRRSFNRIFEVADGIQAISTFLLEWGRKMGYRGGRGVVIPNGVDVAAFTKRFSDEEKQSTRHSFGFPPNAFVLITSSRLEKKNGIKDVVDALVLLPESVCFVVCGSGSLEEDIRAQVTRLGLDSRVRFMGFVPPQRLPLLLKSSDTFIRPSLSEGLGNAFLEAMAARIPVIGTPVGGIPDFLTNRETGFVVNSEDPKSIAEAIVSIRALSRENRVALLDRAESQVIGRYDWDRIAHEMETYFNDIAK